ncbi:Oidioi.mRNA.OKI2018_I69.chr2.g5858.t1.cds [Oikopleura dioica]|uniref:Oidioi.mRNA.OKI2018_I69.chr2.g5858.t1.cds n=1 Tax=Oikopleura dioica TaxID=34765 RepID=A0ABN7T5X2_OIKDI|nr:Oidioi.mRNA.OKI2018_I69.chr2.g5858.t1.cds [Oikopleura dioica]
MQKADILPVPYPRDVTSYGTYGQCHECKYAVDSTAEIRGKRICSECKEKKYPKSSAKFQATDATFKCPARNCEADKLSYHEFYVGSCCDTALNREITAEKEEECVLMQKLYKQAKQDEKPFIKESYDSQFAMYDAKEKVRMLEWQLDDAKSELTIAEDKCAAAEKKLETKKEWRRKIQKRLFIAARTVAKIDNRAFENEIAPKKARQKEVNEKHQCRICLHPYDDERPEAIIIPCAHKFCFNCISALSDKKCPNCRADFADNNVYKTH